jgi:hypothetical protein
LVLAHELIHRATVRLDDTHRLGLDPVGEALLERGVA